MVDHSQAVQVLQGLQDNNDEPCAAVYVMHNADFDMTAEERK